jgi:hypothetical protein
MVFEDASPSENASVMKTLCAADLFVLNSARLQDNWHKLLQKQFRALAKNSARVQFMCALKL